MYNALNDFQWNMLNRNKSVIAWVTMAYSRYPYFNVLSATMHGVLSFIFMFVLSSYACLFVNFKIFLPSHCSSTPTKQTSNHRKCLMVKKNINIRKNKLEINFYIILQICTLGLVLFTIFWHSCLHFCNHISFVDSDTNLNLNSKKHTN